ncbi:hypothetical protein DFJ58DRAFT_666711 [Suillus subalutaceus]|uniref:uncharacterized protein n=1 Tax=Suillus subalutaceus TaxID=48586 RepID=UPI001B87D591|nr:uncharacterized protein DFJ58DRAFT_666711 [Suillus subalutaceus]KAG1841143.1 hypothetical protein DFJ58DRAFT_666711 [Suillus subalutaceus]
MTTEERQALEALRDPPTNPPNIAEDSDDFNLGDIWDGTDALPISHAGGEFRDLARATDTHIRKDQDGAHRVQRVDNRTRRDRVLRRNLAFNEQIQIMSESYLIWSLEKSQKGFKSFYDRLRSEETEVTDLNGGQWPVTVVDAFFAEKFVLKISSTDRTIASALVRQGVMPCSPISPVAGITLEALELYRVAHLRNPHLSIQAFVKTICDLHGVEFHRHISRQFSIALDIYLQIRRVVASLINKSLRRDSPDWRLKHACPACTYTLTDEEKLHFKILYAMDGNDSLKRILRRSLDDDDDSLGLSSELPTGQVLVSDRYLSRNFVEQFAQDTPCDTGANSLAENSCEGRWKNMDDAKTKKAWGIYDETGVFVAVCRHGFCLLIADMVQSGERAKYPLAIVAKLLDAFGDDLGGGYDIGCQFQTTLDNSSLGPLARSLRHSCLVGAFHGHAHRRLCQLFSLTTYIKGIGIEDLETCERTFSKSNSLASALRYTSVFHRQQAIDSYFEHNDELEVYGNLSNFLHGNYKQALEIIANGEAVLPKVMQELKVEDESVFECWLEDEKIYLKGLTREPEEETLQMEYWQRLVNLSASKVALDAGMNMFGTHNTPSYGADIGNTRKVESTRRHALEDYERNLKLVQLLECKLGIIARWVPEDEEWQKAGRLVANRKYQRALDRLEGLVVARIFELAKMNRAGTGYKLRKHIARALQTRSAAIRSALNTYNNLASAVYPPRQILKWEDVVEYAFLADFELLRKTRSDVSQLPWSSPAARSGMDLYFKMCRAREEICRLNIEVRRLVTYIRDEDKYLRVCEDRLTVANPALAHQIAIHRNIRGRFNSRHIKRLNDISKLPGFNGTLVPGLSACTGIGESASMPDPLIPANVFAAHIPAHNPSSPIGADTQEDLDEEEIAEEVAEEASRSLQDIITITADFSQLQVVDNGEVEE